MQVYKACLKIVYKNLPSMLIYLGVFLGFVILMTLFNPQQEVEDFTSAKPRMTIFNEDSGDPLSDGLAEYLLASAEDVKLADNKDTIQDALFYRNTVYILRIPKGFGADFISGSNNTNLIRTTVPDSYQGIYSDQLIDRYLGAASSYLQADRNRDITQTVAAIRNDLGIEAEITVSSNDSANGFSSMIFYYIFMAYSLTAIMILGTSSIMLAFQHRDIRLRNLSSPVKLTSFNLQLVLGNLTFALATSSLLCLVSLIFYDNFADIKRWLLLVLNTIVFAMTIMVLSFLISQFVHNRGVQQAVANVISLGTCFISGVFVPQEMLGESVLAAASFTPTYWYVRAVRLIQHNPELNWGHLRNYLDSLLIQIAFAFAFLAVALVISRQKRQSEKI